MKIGIYAKWLDTLGGGEKVATVMADILSHSGNKVELISTFMPDKKNLESKMSVDLSRVKVVAWEERSYEVNKEKTEKYDLFINTSFLDHQPSLAEKSIYYIHFPTPMNRTILGLIKYETILPILKKRLIIPHIHSGLEIIDDIFSRAGKWLGRKNIIIFSNPPKVFRLKLRIYTESVNINSIDMISIKSPNADVILIDKKLDHFTSTLYYEYKLAMKNEGSAVVEMGVKGSLRKSAALVSLTINDFRYFVWNILKRYLPRYEMALYGSGGFKPEGGIDTYDLLLANSKYSKKWTRKYWKRNPQILHPPVDTEKFLSMDVKKKNIILNVGRFFVGGHSKRQDVLVRAFKEMIDANSIDRSWELHFVGGISGGWEHAEYLKKIKKEAKGYPVYFHISADFSLLKSLYLQAKIYWHATGFGQNELRTPISFEHFGISVVEAMAAGCVPVVFNGGGLPESVGYKNNLLWRSLVGLKKITTRLVSDSGEMGKLSKYYKKEARRYSRKNFGIRLKAFINNL